MNELIYKCPHCDEQFPVGEDSDDYLIPCPRCGRELDLTDLEPENPEPMDSFQGITIDETIRETCQNSGTNPVSTAIQDAILETKIAAIKAAVTVRRGMRFQMMLLRRMFTGGGEPPIHHNRRNRKQYGPCPGN